MKTGEGRAEEAEAGPAAGELVRAAGAPGPAGAAASLPPVRVLKRLAAFCLALALIALFFWAAGNFRRFLDDTQLMLLSVLRWSSLGLGALSLVGAASSLAGGRRASGRLRAAAGWALLVLVGTALALLSEALIVFAAGVP